MRCIDVLKNSIVNCSLSETFREGLHTTEISSREININQIPTFIE